MKLQPKRNPMTSRFTLVLFAIYLLALAWILLFKLGVRFSYMDNRTTNLVPFYPPPVVTGENIMNTVIFVPLGVYAAMLFRRWGFFTKVLFVVFCSFLIEGLQYLFRIGAFDVTDIITNSLGGIAGVLVFMAIEKAFNNRRKAQQFINFLAALGTVSMLILLVLLKMNLLPIRYQ